MEVSQSKVNNVTIIEVTGDYLEVAKYGDSLKEFKKLYIDNYSYGVVGKFHNGRLDVVENRTSSMVYYKITGDPVLVDLMVNYIIKEYPTPGYGTWVDGRDGAGEGQITASVHRFSSCD